MMEIRPMVAKGQGMGGGINSQEAGGTVGVRERFSILIAAVIGKLSELCTLSG